MTDPVAAEASASRSYYEARRKIYARETSGRFDRLRQASAWVLLGLYYLLPWLPWDGRQSVLFDLPARKFYVFGLVFWPQDFIFLTWLLVILGLSLFFFTAIAGRLWCGFACPQTIWTEVFVRIERAIEGDRNRRIRLDRGPWNRDKLARKTAKHALWAVLALWTGFTFVGFFTPIHELAGKVVTLSTGPWETFWVLFYGFATWGNAGFMREQVCKYMCPYARFQSAMFDRNTLVIAYDAGRGEPRGPRPRQADPQARGLGDCVDCMACVQVCPTGIDIRAGLQYECIACGACIDACDDVMDRMGYRRGLVRFTSQSALEQGRSRVLRPRVVLYGTALGLLVAGFAAAIALRTPLALDVMRDRNALYRTLPDGRIENVYLVRILNKDTAAHRFALSVEGLPGASLDADRPQPVVAAGGVHSLPVRVRVAPGGPAGSHAITLRVVALDAPRLSATRPARFLTP